MSYSIIQTTVGNRSDAQRIASALVEDRLAACVQIVGPIQSVYRWQGNVETEEEFRCEIKTSSDKFGAAQRRIAELHPYDVPEIVCIPISEMSASYQDWLRSQISETG